MWIVLAITLVIIVLVLVMLTLLNRSLPITQGRLAVPGLEGEVTVIRDKWGVPHIDRKSVV